MMRSLYGFEPQRNVRSSPAVRRENSQSHMLAVICSVASCKVDWSRALARSLQRHVPLGRIVPLGENHLRAAVRGFVDHYHEERPHQGLGNDALNPTRTAFLRSTPYQHPFNSRVAITTWDNASTRLTPCAD